MNSKKSYPICNLPKSPRAVEAIYSLLWKRPKTKRLIKAELISQEDY